MKSRISRQRRTAGLVCGLLLCASLASTVAIVTHLRQAQNLTTNQRLRMQRSSPFYRCWWDIQWRLLQRDITAFGPLQPPRSLASPIDE
jgi:hypothetical protein